MGAALTEILCLRKDQGGKKNDNFSHNRKNGRKKVIPGLSLEEKKACYVGAVSSYYFVASSDSVRSDIACLMQAMND